MKRLAIISPNFPPTNGADMHRVRAVIPHLQEFGWEPTVIAVDPNCIQIPQDPWLEAGIPSEVVVHRVNALGTLWSQLPGLGSIEGRSLGNIRRKGNALFSKSKFDLIYFSTTSFGVHVLGPYWKRRFAVPFAMDYQDPWVNDYYRENPTVVPPGGRIKYGIVDRINRYREPRVLRECSGLTSVSPLYPTQLVHRYPWMTNKPFRVLPFPGVLSDLERAGMELCSQHFFDKSDGLRHWVYVGRGGDDMAFALAGLFAALRTWRDVKPGEYARTRLHFIGTSYAPPGKGRRTIVPIAAKHGVEDIVFEQTDRIQYRLMLQCLLDADALIVPGSNDAAYTASKLYPYLLARKPLLAVFNQKSSVVEIVGRVGGARLVTFSEESSPEQLALSVYSNWFEHDDYLRLEPLNADAFEPYTDRGSTRLLCQFFDSVINSAK